MSRGGWTKCGGISNDAAEDHLVGRPGVVNRCNRESAGLLRSGAENCTGRKQGKVIRAPQCLRRKPAAAADASFPWLNAGLMESAALASGTAAGFAPSSHTSFSPTVQAKLSINQPDDAFEREADSVADLVMKMDDPNARQKADTGSVNDKQAIMTAPLDTIACKATGDEYADADVSGIVASGAWSGGSPLDNETRSFMEPRFGYDFSQVRVHTDARASDSAAALSARAYTVGTDLVFRSGEYAPGSTEGRRLLAHELTHVVQQSSAVQRKAVREKAPGSLVQRDNTADQLKALDARTKVLEQKSAATNLDMKYRALFGEKMSTYKQVVYRLTAAFQTASQGFQTAHANQAALQAIIDQIAATIIVTAGAFALEPFLAFSLGKLKPHLDKINIDLRVFQINPSAKTVTDYVEKLENPGNAMISGTGNTVTTYRQGDRAAHAPTEGIATGAQGAGVGGGDPLTFLASNLEALEKHTQTFESAFADRATQYDAAQPEDWSNWTKEAQEAKYAVLLAQLDTVALGDIKKLEDPQTLAVKVELYLWAAWFRNTIRPGVSGVQLGRELAKRLQVLGVQSLAGVTLDTESWIFMEHKPDNWQDNLLNWAKGWSQPLTR